MMVALLPKQQFIFIAFTTLCLWWHRYEAAAAAVTASNTQLQKTDINNIKDKIIELQCYAKCERISLQNIPTLSAIATSSSSDLHTCHEQCKSNMILTPRHGYCPSTHGGVIFQNIKPIQSLYCLDNCSYDSDCPEVEKCCNSTCGPVCMSPLNIRDDASLPPIPKILKYKLPRGHKVEITIESSANSIYYCHVEVRFHIGLHYSPRKMSDWQLQHVEKIAEISDKKTKRTDIAFNLRPGHWYQVRVAAINENGFRGYSEPSDPFSLPYLPKPPKPPKDLKVISARRMDNGKYYAVTINWCPSKSNLPIEKYKIIWSLYVKSNDESLISYDAYVKDIHQYEIKNLTTDSSYYIQVQAMTISGKRRLKSEKRSMLFNTTAANLNVPLLTLNCTQQQQQKKHHLYNKTKSYQKSYKTTTTTRTNESFNNTKIKDNTIMNSKSTATAVVTSIPIPAYQLRFRWNRKIGMIVQISGFHPHKEKVYELCPKDTNCEQREYNAIRAKKDSMEFSKLKYFTTYMLKAYRTNGTSKDDTHGSFTFTTPKCENFRKRFPKMQIKC